MDAPSRSLDLRELRNLRVLVVDDNKTNQLIFGRILEYWGMKATLASSGLEALRILNSEQPFALILLDYHMPGMDGIDLAQRIRSNPRFATATILMLSSGGGPRRSRSAPAKRGSPSASSSPSSNRNFSLQSSKPWARPRARTTGRAPRAASAAGSGEPAAAHPSGRRQSSKPSCGDAVARETGHKVVTVDNGRDAVTTAETQDFDLALLDLQMPEMDGLQAIGLIRHHEETTGRSHLPVVALTAHAIRGDRERCLAAGMDGYISKPINRVELFDVIESVLQSCRLGRAPLLPPHDHQLPGNPLAATDLGPE